MPDSGVSVMSGFGSEAGFAVLQRGAALLAASTMMPKEYAGNVANCAIALEMSQRIGANPLMVAQNLNIVHGRPGWSSQFLIATFNQCGRFSALRYEWQDEEGQETWGCRAWSIENASKERLEGSWITIGLAKREGWVNRNGSKWQTMPQQMLMYRAAAWFVRVYAPEVSMGLHTVEELRDIDVTELPSSAVEGPEERLKRLGGAAAKEPVVIQATPEWSKGNDLPPTSLPATPEPNAFDGQVKQPAPQNHRKGQELVALTLWRPLDIEQKRAVEASIGFKVGAMARMDDGALSTLIAEIQNRYPAVKETSQ